MVTLVIAKLVKSLPARFTAAFAGAVVLAAWFVYDVLSAFIILPFSTNLTLTVAASLVLGLTIVSIIALISLTAAYSRTVAIFISFILLVLITVLSASHFDQSRNAVVPAKVPAEPGPRYPASPGKFKIKKLIYGSGTDKQRPEYGSRADLKTRTADGSFLMPPGWSAARTGYWGFDQTRLPINGRVRYPEENGSFPLVLIVHGNRDMTEFSDNGFAYLGELLASRGYIVASVDENFLNYGTQRYGDFKESDVDARGWLLLQHLTIWREWNRAKGGPFYKKVDMDRIALIGHSRGGEAIAAAAAFNRMGRYPKNGNVQFKFDFKIKTLIALAPSDIQQPAYERTTPAEIKDVNYLLLLGTHDRQVPAILGSRIYQRVHFTRGEAEQDDYFVKAALFIYGGNHSQFNSDSGIYDFPWPYRLFTNLKEQLNAEEQRRIVKIYASAFLDATLKGDKRYIALFRDYRTIEGWLPKTAYISRFQDSAFHAVADFDEDIDPATATIPGGEIIGRALSQWHEQDIDYHYFLPFGSRSNRVVAIGWISGEKCPPMWGIRLPAREVKAWMLKPENRFTFSLLCPDQKTMPEVMIRLADAQGRESELPLSSVLKPHAPLRISLTKMHFLEQPSPVTVLQTVSIPFSLFLKSNPSLNLAKLREIDFVFKGKDPGKILLDDIGIEQ